MKVTHIRHLVGLDNMSGREDIDWCQCYESNDYHNYYCINHESRYEAVRIGDKDIEGENALVQLAKAMKPDFDEAEDDPHDVIDSSMYMHRCGCLGCPWSDDCDAVQEPIGEIYKVIDDDGDETYVAETEDDLKNETPFDDLRSITASDIAAPLTDDDSDEPSFKALDFMDRHFHEEFEKIGKIPLFEIDVGDGNGMNRIYWDTKTCLLSADFASPLVDDKPHESIYLAKNAVHDAHDKYYIYPCYEAKRPTPILRYLVH